MKREPPKSLAEAVARLAIRNAELAAYLGEGGSTALERVADAPSVPLPDATERARQHWDTCERRRSSRPPEAKR